MIADRLHLVLKINLSGLPAFPWERQDWLVGQQVLAENLHLFVARSFEFLFEFAVAVFTCEVVERGAPCLSL